MIFCISGNHINRYLFHEWYDMMCTGTCHTCRSTLDWAYFVVFFLQKTTKYLHSFRCGFWYLMLVRFLIKCISWNCFLLFFVMYTCCFVRGWQSIFYLHHKSEYKLSHCFKARGFLWKFKIGRIDSWLRVSHCGVLGMITRQLKLRTVLLWRWHFIYETKHYERIRFL